MYTYAIYLFLLDYKPAHLASVLMNPSVLSAVSIFQKQLQGSP